MDENKKESSFSDKIKEGVSVHEIETFARKYTTEAFIILAIIIGATSSIFGFFTCAKTAIFFAAIGSIVSISFPDAILVFEKKYFEFVAKQEKPAQIAIGIVKIAIALFVPFITFAQIGLLAGVAFHHFSRNPVYYHKIKEEKIEKDLNDEEHI
jgi:uncharacterized membrane protein